MSFALALKEPPDAEVELEAGVAAGAAAPEPTAEADGPTDGAADGDGDGVGALAGETELGDPEAVPGVAADGDGDGDAAAAAAAAGTGADGAPEAEAPFGIAAANHAVTHPWYAWNSILICDLMASVFAVDEPFEAPIHEMKVVVSDWSILN